MLRRTLVGGTGLVGLASLGRWARRALCSLASHAFEHPGDTFPEFVEEHGCLEAEGIGHPLIPEDKLVTNDVRLGRGPRNWQSRPTKTRNSRAR